MGWSVFAVPAVLVLPTPLGLAAAFLAPKVELLGLPASPDFEVETVEPVSEGAAGRLLPGAAPPSASVLGVSLELGVSSAGAGAGAGLLPLSMSGVAAGALPGERPGLRPVLGVRPSLELGALEPVEAE